MAKIEMNPEVVSETEKRQTLTRYTPLGTQIHSPENSQRQKEAIDHRI